VINRALNTVPYFIDHFEVAAVGRCFESGALLATRGDLVNWTGTLDCKFLTCSTCKITKALEAHLLTLMGMLLA